MNVEDDQKRFEAVSSKEAAGSEAKTNYFICCIRLRFHGFRSKEESYSKSHFVVCNERQ